MFPQGGPGVALLLVRISVAAAFLMNLAHRSRMPEGFLEFALVLLISLVSLSLSVGFLTPFLSAIVCAADAANQLLGFNAACTSGNLIYLFTMFLHAVLAILGWV